MSAPLLSLHVLTFAFTLWLGLYLLARARNNGHLLFAGLGVSAYAITLFLSAVASATGSAFLHEAQWAFSFLPALFWTGTLMDLLPETLRVKTQLNRLWLYSVLPLSGLLFLFSLGTPFVASAGLELSKYLFAAISLIPLLFAFFMVLRYFRQIRPNQSLILVLIATLFFALGAGALLLPLSIFPRGVTLFILGSDLSVLGLSIALFDALDMGETLLPDITRSFSLNALLNLVLAGQVALVIALSGQTLPLMLLLFSSITLITLLQAFAQPLQNTLDALIFARQPRLLRERAELRAASSAIIRSKEEEAELSTEDFTRLTRKALSNFADLSKLGSSPLARLPIITQRLDAKGAKDDTLSRAQELKRLLVESVLKLKPQVAEDFGSTDEWRHYNVLFFPYIIGIKPFSQRADHRHLDSVAKEALEYFRTYVPERTFYNWQRSAADLVATTLKEENEKLQAV